MFYKTALISARSIRVGTRQWAPPATTRRAERVKGKSKRDCKIEIVEFEMTNR